MGETSFFLTETLKRYIRFNPYDKNNFALWWPFCITFVSNQIKSIYLRSVTRRVVARSLEPKAYVEFQTSFVIMKTGTSCSTPDQANPRLA